MFMSLRSERRVKDHHLHFGHIVRVLRLARDGVERRKDRRQFDLVHRGEGEQVILGLRETEGLPTTRASQNR